MTTLHMASPHQSHATTRSTFGRRVTDEEFNVYKQELLDSYQDSTLKLRDKDIDPQLCFVRKHNGIPIIGTIWLLLQNIADQFRISMTLSNKHIKAGDRIFLAHKTVRKSDYSEQYTEALNTDPKDMERTQSHYTKVLTPLTRNTKDLAIDNIQGAFKINKKAKNERFEVGGGDIIQITEQPESKPNPESDN